MLPARAAVAFATLLSFTVAQAQSPAPTPPQSSKAAPASPRPAEEFAEIPTVDTPTLSPDGKAYAARIAVNGTQYFAVVPLGDGGKPHIVGTDSDIIGWDWVNNDWLVVTYGESVPVQGEDWYVTAAASVEAATGRTVRLSARDSGQNGGDVIWIAHDGSPRILMSAQHSIFTDDPDFWPSVVEVDVSTGRSKSVQRAFAEVWNWYADSQGVVRMGISRSLDGRESKLLYRGVAGAWLKEVARQRRGENGYIRPALFLGAGDKAVAFADDENGFNAVYDYDLATHELGAKLYGSKVFDIGGVVANARGDALAGVKFGEDASRIEWIDPDLAALQTEIAALVKSANVTLVSYSDDHQRAIAYVHSPDSPGAYLLYDRVAKASDVLAFRNQHIRFKRLNPVSTIHYKAADGLDIAAVLTLPKGREAKMLPLIVMPHGGPFARDDESWDWWAQFLAERGYAVVQPNYRGSSGYGTAFGDAGKGEWGLKMQDDLNDAITALAAKGIADPKRVCMVGGSYGGYAAMRAAQRDGRFYRCAVSFAGVSDLAAMRRYDSQFLSGEARGDWLKDQAPNFDLVSPRKRAAEFSIPILIVHGKKDRVVPYAQSREMAENLRAAGKPVIFVTQPEGDHHFSRYEDRLSFLKALEAFLAEHNPA